MTVTEDGVTVAEDGMTVAEDGSTGTGMHECLGSCKKGQVGLTITEQGLSVTEDVAEHCGCRLGSYENRDCRRLGL